MEYKFIYLLMPKWTKFIYCFDVMIKNKSGSLHLYNGYYLDFEAMTIEAMTIEATDCCDCVLWKQGKEDGTCIHYVNKDCPCGYCDEYHGIKE